MRNNTARKHGFTMIELLVVIAIIAILAAILFPVFATVREQARQSSTMSNLQSVYQSLKLYYEDEQRYPNSLFGYAQTCTRDGSGNCTPGTYRFAVDNTNIVPMAQTITVNPLYPYLFRDQAKDLAAFSSGDELVTNRSEITEVYYPVNSPLGSGSITNGILSGGTRVEWTATNAIDPNYVIHGDTDLPAPGYVGQPKMFYKMDAMDIGPMVDNQGRWVTKGGAKVYALHYTPDWTRLAGAANDVDTSGQPYVAQLKYKNPPSDRTIITYNTHHAAIAGSGKVMALFLDGRAKKVDLQIGLNQFPLNYGK